MIWMLCRVEADGIMYLPKGAKIVERVDKDDTAKQVLILRQWEMLQQQERAKVVMIKVKDGMVDMLLGKLGGKE